MLALFCARKHAQHEASREERKTLNSQHEAGKEMESHALKSRKINRAEPKYVKFVWLSSPRPPPPCGICWLDFRSWKFKEKTNLNTLHMTWLDLCSLSNYSACRKTTSRNSNRIFPTKTCTPYPQCQLSLLHGSFSNFFVLWNVFFCSCCFLNWSGTITVLPTHKSSWKQALPEKKNCNLKDSQQLCLDRGVKCNELPG